jgi:hypothetical protein
VSLSSSHLDWRGVLATLFATCYLFSPFTLTYAYQLLTIYSGQRWQPIVIQAATAVGDDETEVAYAALRLLKSLAAHPAGQAVLFSEGVLAALQQQSVKQV